MNVSYQADGLCCEGYLVNPKEMRHAQPAVLIAHAWYGQDEFARKKAHELADLGYIALAIDMFGHRKNATCDEEASSLIKPLYLDRKLLQVRISAAFETLLKQPGVDGTRVGAIGFCFGGLAVIELLRSGAPIKSVVSFHAVINYSGVNSFPIAKNIKGSILLLHGYEDPLCPSKEIQYLQRELNDARVDWQMDIYGMTSHAFTNPLVNDKKKGLIYNEKASTRAWLAMKNFFHETLGR
ncbi:putative carboxymethylenebutenolidase [Neochlamydia sp. TUME1]|uniref:dienelactone hydrolase family protein n=1 Tax=Neochlamydia sp. TUME1 TaxID=1478174 RepID=UPI00057EA3AE|nr:dienelactone hydrolase family protein [Neochlamydia sp. TUME1]KIC76440.1 putative carboxymethylenebutenolidase [Neochlamydia sp. TUME1]